MASHLTQIQLALVALVELVEIVPTTMALVVVEFLAHILKMVYTTILVVKEQMDMPVLAVQFGIQLELAVVVEAVEETEEMEVDNIVVMEEFGVAEVAVA
jgi:hypothetical protein